VSDCLNCFRLIVCFLLGVFWTIAFSMPPQIISINTKIQTVSILEQCPLCIYGNSGPSGMLYVCNIDTSGGYYCRYSQLSKNGLFLIQDFPLIRCNPYFAPENIKILEDNNTVHLVYYSPEIGLHKYLMLDENGKKLKEIDLIPNIFPSDMRIMPDKRIVINATIKNWADPEEDVFCIKDVDANDFDVIHILSPIALDGMPDKDASMFPLDEDRILLLQSTYDFRMGSETIRECYLRKTIVNIKSESVEEFQIFPIRDSSSFYYSGLSPNFDRYGSKIITMDDYILYWNEGSSYDLSRYMPSDTMCVLKFETNGKLIYSKPDSVINIKYCALDSIGTRSIIFQDNANEQLIAKSEWPVNYFGVMSFAKFPQIEIDREKR
jgi:hypothetical protein